MIRSTLSLTACALAALSMTACASRPKPQASLAEAPVSEAPDTPTPPTAAPDTISRGGQAELAATAGDRVYFAFDSHDLAPDARDSLARQAAWLASQGVAAVIAGSADERGTREYNLALGARRAAAARDFLIAQGVDAGRLTTVSYGKERPLDPASNEEAWARNRNAHTQVTAP